MARPLLIRIAGPLGVVGGSGRGAACRVALTCSIVMLCAVSGARADGLEWRTAFDWFASAQGILPPGNPANRGNQVLRIPLLAIENEARPSLRFDYASFQFVVRPSFAAAVSTTRVEDEWHEPRLGIRADWVDLYGAWNVTDSLSLTYGLQNYQWGPAETLSPSNPIFHLPYTRTVLTLIRGKHLFRANISPSRSWSLVVVLEPRDNGEPAFVYGVPFDRKALIKLEYTRPSGDRYLGITAGKGETSSGWIGEYGVLSLTDAFSIYGDARHTMGSDALYPTGVLEPGQSFALSRARSRAIETVGVAGARYQFAGGEDLRIEYLHNDPGYSADELALSAQTVARLAATDPSVVGAYTSPGLDIPGRMYLYASARFPELGPHDHLGLSAQYLQSLTTRNGALFVNTEWIYNDSLVFFISAAAVLGTASGDLTRLTRGYWLMGSRFSR
jgi:hypothetical protein